MRLVYLGTLATCVLLAACSSERGQLVMGFATDLPARTELDHVKLTVTKRGETIPTLTADWDLSDVPAGDYHLPGSFALYGDPGANPVFDVALIGTLGGMPAVRRDSALSIESGSDRFMRLTLVGACEQLGCPASLVCVEGECKPKAIDVRSLPRYSQDLVNEISCSSGIHYIDSSTHLPMPTKGDCAGDDLCSEGTCLRSAKAIGGKGGGDTMALMGGAGELYGSGGFFPVGEIDSPRYLATATTLRDGRVLVVGGFGDPSIGGGNSGPIEGALVYTPAQAAFSRLAQDPPASLGGHTATLLGDGTVLFVGAANNTPVAFVFDPTDDSWSSLSPPQRARYFHTATALPDGRVLIFGGSLSPNGPGFTPVDTAEIFDPMTHAFTTTNGPPMKVRDFHTATLLNDGRVMVSGGRQDDSPIRDVELFDPASGTFTLASVGLSYARAFHTATLLSDGNVLVVGGESERDQQALAEAEIYSPTAMSPPDVPPAPFGRLRQQAIPLGNDRVLFVAGAESFSGQTLVAAGGAYLYDYAANTFTQLPDPKIPRVDAFSAVLAGGDALVGGGAGSTSGGGDGGFTTGDGGTFFPDGGTFFPDGGSSGLCDPITSAGCSGATPRCSIAGDSMYGPRLMSSQGPRCADQQLGGIGQTCDTPTTDMGVTHDDCMTGSVCMGDYDGTLRCLQVCRYDNDCNGTRPVCAQVITAGGVAYGACMPSCDIEAGMDCETQLNSATTCRWVHNVGSSAGPIRVSAACMQSGMLPNNSTCLGNSYDTECSPGTYCDNGLCEIVCTPTLACSSTTCTKIVAEDPVIEGVCK